MNPCRDHTNADNCPQCRTFDQADPKNLGRPLYWSLEDHVKAAEGLIKADEIEMAFKFLDMVPAWYRENYPPELMKIKKILWENLYSPMTYVNDEEEASYTKEKAEAQFLTPYTHPRAEVLLDLVQKLNADGKRPWIFELSTSHGLLPLGLAKHGARFDFFAKNFNQAALAKVIEWLGPDVWKPRGPGIDQPTIFINTECLEHAYREEDIRDDYYKMAIDFDYILLSVPYGCLGGGLDNWKTRRLGHIRGYTKDEFLSLAQRFFPQRAWKMIVANSQVLIGKKI